MTFRDDCRFAACRSALLVAVALSGCSDGVGSLMVDPEQYSVYHCDQLATQLQNLITREKQLRDLMNRASQGGGGTVIGELAYRTDYESVLTQEKMVRRDAAQKKCPLTPAYTSDQTIR